MSEPTKPCPLCGKLMIETGHLVINDVPDVMYTYNWSCWQCGHWEQRKEHIDDDFDVNYERWKQVNGVDKPDASP